MTQVPATATFTATSSIGATPSSITPSTGAWTLNEDEALKLWLSDLVVSDERNPSRKVGVWFRSPDVEIQKQTFPFITIDLIDVREATERAMRNRVTLGYTPVGAMAPVSGQGYDTNYPIPYDLTYQVTTFARHPLHDRQMIWQIMQNKLGGRMHTLYVPQDDTQRSMFLVGSQKRDSIDSTGRRLFSNAYTVQVFTELLPSQIFLLPQVSTITQTITSTVDLLIVPTS